MPPSDRAATEQWFLRRGLPHFIEGYDARHDILTRAVPVLVAVFLAQTLNALNLRDGWSWWANLGAFAGGLALAVGAWAAVNRARRRRPFERPQSVGPVELAVFLLVPPLIPLVFGAQVGSAALTLAANVVVLGAVYIGTSYGVVPMTRWAFGRLLAEVGAVFGMMVRALPLLLLFVTFLFVNVEAWQVASSLEWTSIALVGALFLGIGSAFAALRVPRQVGGLPAPRHPLGRRQRGNVALVMLATEGIQVALVTAGIFVFFSLFGFLAVEESVVRSWLGAQPDVLASLTLGGQTMVLTTELLKVATFLSLFSGLIFTVSLLTDATYREEFLAPLLAEIREALAVRDGYLAGDPA